MDSPKDTAMSDDNVDIHKPFTVEENIRQLNDIDKSIVQLMNHTSTAVSAVSMPASSATTPEEQKDTLHAATNSFLDTLSSVNVRMKRQIMALEEAGIVNLASAPKQERGVAAQPSLKPNGTGNVGSLDVGWLNSRGSKVEREMEAELWAKAKARLEKDGDKMTEN